jgi:hypothetical protein
MKLVSRPTLVQIVTWVLLLHSLPTNANRSAIQDVSVRPGFLNAALKQQATFSFRLGKSGDITVLVLDRDGFPVRRLAENRVKAGQQTLNWDGRDDAGVPVPDEAYTIRIDLKAGAATYTYFPAQDPPGEMFNLTKATYDRREGLISYTLPKPSRVHCQAGTAKLDAAGVKGPHAPVLKTIVDRQPRLAGSIVEAWDGHSESGDLILVPELRDFVIGVACTPLPENAVITGGNRNTTFRDYASARKGKSLLVPRAAGDHHHAGLTGLQDTSPVLALDVQRSESGRPYQVTMDLSPTAASVLRSLGGRVVVFVDGEMISSHAPGPLPMKLPLPDTLKAGPHVLAVNWATGRGPTGVGTLRLQIPAPSAKEAQR